MKTSILQSVLGSALVFLTAQQAEASHAHRHHHLHRQPGSRHVHGHHGSNETVNASHPVEKRSTCSLPDHPDLVNVAGAQNNGFAMSPDQPCTPGKYCPFACVPGKVMAQWDPDSKYSYPESMNGGLYCDGGKAQKPFPDKPYCVDGTGTVSAINKCGKVISFCQTVLPGNEAMLIPTDVHSDVVLSVPGPSYWAGTAAHYYINPPGISASEGCVWGESSKPVGNWSPYVAGANTVSNGDTFLKLAWNPIWTGSDLAKKEPPFGVKIECDGDGCNGLPCSINPAKDGSGGLESPVSENGVGGAEFCVVTVPKGVKGKIVLFNTDGSGGDSPPSSYPSPTAKPSTRAPPSSTPTPTSFATSRSSSSHLGLATVLPGLFQENTTDSSDFSSASQTAISSSTPTSGTPQSASASPSTKKSEGAAEQGGAAMAGLMVALFAAAALY